MFRRTTENLPTDPHYPADLNALGFKVNESGQIVKNDTSGEHFDFYHTSSERANEVRKEAVHTCARKEVIERMGELGVKELFLHGEKYERTKPKDRYVVILATELKELVGKKDVIVIVNESKQDLGMWAYRQLMREPGIDGGSAVGMIKKLQDWGEPSTEEVSFRVTVLWSCQLILSIQP